MAPTQTAQKRILLVEDEKCNRQLAEKTISAAGYQVLTAADGEEALRKAADELPDLILLDMILPKVDGFEILKRLKHNLVTSHIPVVVVTSLAQDNNIQEALQKGARDYWVKNGGYREVVQRLAGWMVKGAE